MACHSSVYFVTYKKLACPSQGAHHPSIHSDEHLEHLEHISTNQWLTSIALDAHLII
jgi:hypothetical protein